MPQAKLSPVTCQTTLRPGDAVLVRGPDGAEIGRGLIAYDSDENPRTVLRRSN